MGTCSQVEVHLKLLGEVPFFVHPYAVKEEQKLVMQKDMNHL